MKTPISDMLDNYGKSQSVRMHMPGHKGKGGAVNLYDVTELSFTDNLLSPAGAILQSEKNSASEYGVKYCHYLVNGSTSGIFALVMCAEGKILAEKSCHVSVRNAASLFNKQLVEIDNTVEDGIPKPLTVEQIKKAAEENADAYALILTSPNYFGNTADLKNIYKYLKQRKIKLFVDSAHGAHFGFSKLLPQNACLYSDAAVESSHKTLIALTQTAILLTDDREIYEKTLDKLRLITTTSPSFVFLRSIEKSVAHVAENGKNAYETLYKEFLRFKESIERDGWELYPNDDFTRIVIDCAQKGYDGRKIYAALEKKGVYCERATKRYLVAILTLNDSGLSLDALATSLANLRVDSAVFNGSYIESCFK